MSSEKFQKSLLDWFDSQGRKDLPWQQPITPYRVWLSEIMLQQTQVSTVIPYFNKFIARYPTIHSLAESDSDEIMEYWSGLGYYARARNLHKTAQIIANQGGEFPQTITELCALPGIGLSTAGAILSIAFGQSQPILDGNVKRVLTRFYAITEWPGEKKVLDRLWTISRLHTPNHRPGAYTQAIMDLGATLCVRSKPKCEICPIASACLAFAQGLTQLIPKSKPKPNLPVKKVFFLLLLNPSGAVFLEKRPPSGIWGGLWSLPEFSELQQIHDWCLQRNLTICRLQTQLSQRHSFSHYHLEYTPVFTKVINPINNVMEANTSLWYKTANLNKIGLPAPIKQLLQSEYLEAIYDQNG